MTLFEDYEDLVYLYHCCYCEGLEQYFLVPQKQSASSSSEKRLEAEEVRCHSLVPEDSLDQDQDPLIQKNVFLDNGIGDVFF